MFEKIIDLIDEAVKIGTLILAVIIYRSTKDKGE
jgi:hypothetical protein